MGDCCQKKYRDKSESSELIHRLNRIEGHIRTCVVEDIRAGQDGKVEELLEAIQKFIK